MGVVYEDFVIPIKVLWFQASSFKYWLIIIGDTVSSWLLSSSFSFCNKCNLTLLPTWPLPTSPASLAYLVTEEGGRSWVVRYYVNYVLTNEVNFVLFALSWTPVVSINYIIGFCLSPNFFRVSKGSSLRFFPF